jgi:hypothetical protein
MPLAIIVLVIIITMIFESQQVLQQGQCFLGHVFRGPDPIKEL